MNYLMKSESYSLPPNFHHLDKWDFGVLSILF